MATRLAIFSDIHVNLQAMDVVAGHIKQSGVDDVYCLGDLGGYALELNEVQAVKRCHVRHYEGAAKVCQESGLWLAQGREKGGMKLIPTRVHGGLDYVFAGTLFVLPGLLGWGAAVTLRVKIAAVGTLLYSLVTKYEWGLGPLQVLPMKGHLAFDGGSGALFCAAPLLMPDEPQAVKNILVGVGVFELLVTLNSQTEMGEQ